MRDAQDLPHVAVTVQENEILAGAAKVLAFIRPEWKPENINYKMFTDGITNKLVACSCGGGLADSSDVILVRVYGAKTDLLIDRKAETRNLRVMHNAGYAPRLYATFENGLAYEYVPGDTLTTETCCSPTVYPLVARMMANMHKLDCGDTKKDAMIWSKARSFVKLTPDTFTMPEKQKRYLELQLPSKIELDAELVALEKELRPLGSPLVFCHNDLLLGNAVYNESKSAVTFIDYEYAAYNHQAFDIGNHFNEFAGVSTVDYSLFPDLEFQRAWLRVYLKEFNDKPIKQLENGDASHSEEPREGGEEPSEEEVEKLLVLVNKFALASHFLWGTWALVQTEHSTINFDYLEYASVRLKEYHKRKTEFLAMSYPAL